MAACPPREEPAIRVDTLGRLAILPAGGQPTSGLPPVHSALLVFLAVERDVSREEALALFWPESRARHARHSLNQVLHRLRTDLGGGWLRVSADRNPRQSCVAACRRVVHKYFLQGDAVDGLRHLFVGVHRRSRQ